MWKQKHCFYPPPPFIFPPVFAQRGWMLCKFLHCREGCVCVSPCVNGSFYAQWFFRPYVYNIIEYYRILSHDVHWNRQNTGTYKIYGFYRYVGVLNTSSQGAVSLSAFHLEEWLDWDGTASAPKEAIWRASTYLREPVGVDSRHWTLFSPIPIESKIDINDYFSFSCRQSYRQTRYN